MSKNKNYKPGDLESSKFAYMKEPYRKGLQEIKSLGYKTEDYIHYFPAFCGHLTLVRYLSLYEAYKQVSNVAGHIAECGIYKGACSLLWAKLVKIFEPNSLTLVHGFDWFKGGGNLSQKETEFVTDGVYSEDFDRLNALIKAQQLENILKVHNINLANEMIDNFFEKYPHLFFKLVFIDVGIESVLIKSFPIFWERLVKGGMIVFDHYSFDMAPAEAKIINELIPDVEIRTFPYGWMPTAYAVK